MTVVGAFVKPEEFRLNFLPHDCGYKIAPGLAALLMPEDC